MKFKFLFLGMLATVLFVGCNNESVINPDLGGTEPEGISTTATFQFKVTNPNTYAGESAVVGTANENAISDGALFIYKLDGTPEAYGYLGSTLTSITLKCKSGDKYIYMATNIGAGLLVNPTNTNPISPLLSANTSAPNYLGVDWSISSNNPKTFPALNTPIWSTGTAVAPTIAIANTFSAATVADGLIKALNANGNATTGVLGGANSVGTAFLMSNWNGPVDTVTLAPPSTYPSACRFTLKPGISATTSQGAAPNLANNSLVINIQRALAKIRIDEIPASVLTTAGNATNNKGLFVPEAKWAVGNINMSEYPFQQYDGDVVRSTRYDDTASILNAAYNWSNKMDNSRWGGSAYAAQNLQMSGASGVITALGGASNQAFSTAANTVYSLVPENNNGMTLNAYSTFVVFAGQYRPNRMITSVSNAGVVSDTAVWPASWPVTVWGAQVDTIFYVGSIDSGRFFLGMEALKKYTCFITLNLGMTGDPNSAAVANKINGYRATGANIQADLQEYWHGYCLYRVWVRDNNASQAANKILARRNHIYQIAITKILGPGVGNPNHLIDPDPKTPEPIEEAETYVTANINVMNWHLVRQDTEVDLQGK